MRHIMHSVLLLFEMNYNNIFVYFYNYVAKKRDNEEIVTQ